MLSWFCDDSGKVSSSLPRLYIYINMRFALFAQIHAILESPELVVASFKEVLTKDSKIESSRMHQMISPLDEKKMDHFAPFDPEEPIGGEDDISNIDEMEVPDCEKLENLFLIGKLLGESVPLKTIASKTRADRIPSGEIKYMDMGNGFSLIKFANEMDCNHAFFDQLWFVQEQIVNL